MKFFSLSIPIFSSWYNFFEKGNHCLLSNYRIIIIAIECSQNNEVMKKIADNEYSVSMDVHG